MADLELTKTERRMLDVLSDGMPHTKAELHACVNDELGCSMHMHISNLREKIVAKGLNIMHFRGAWILMRRLNSAE